MAVSVPASLLCDPATVGTLAQLAARLHCSTNVLQSLVTGVPRELRDGLKVFRAADILPLYTAWLIRHERETAARRAARQRRVLERRREIYLLEVPTR